MKRPVLLLLFLFVILFPGVSQALPPSEPLMPEEYDPSEFPLWTQDLRRFEIISLGSFPLTFFAASLVYDFSLFAANSWAPEYSMGTQRGSTDVAIIIGSAAAASLLIATADLIINTSKRKRSENNEQREIPSPDS